MKVVSNASPLITFARIGHLESLRQLYPAIQIPTEVYNEVVIAGAGMPGASAIAKAEWIHVSAVEDVKGWRKRFQKQGWGAGEMSGIILSKELSADLTLMDEWRGRRVAIEKDWPSSAASVFWRNCTGARRSRIFARSIRNFSSRISGWICALLESLGRFGLSAL